jgi:uncharacterized membrane protein
MTKKEVIEAEIIEEPKGFNYREKYYEYSEETKKVSKFAWIIALLSLPLSLIPIFGFIFAIFAFIVCQVKKVPVILPFFALLVSGIITAFVLVISAFLSLIF